MITNKISPHSLLEMECQREYIHWDSQSKDIYFSETANHAMPPLEVLDFVINTQHQLSSEQAKKLQFIEIVNNQIFVPRELPENPTFKPKKFSIINRLSFCCCVFRLSNDQISEKIRSAAKIEADFIISIDQYYHDLHKKIQDVVNFVDFKTNPNARKIRQDILNMLEKRVDDPLALQYAKDKLYQDGNLSKILNTTKLKSKSTYSRTLQLKI